MTTRSFHVLLEWDPEDRVWLTCVPALNYLSTYGDTRDEALESTREAIIGYLEAAAKEEITISGGNTEAELVSVEISVP